MGHQKITAGTVITQERTYLGARARVTETHHDSNVVGLREIVTEWIDDADPANGGHKAGTITRKLVKGDGRRADFQVIEPESIVRETPKKSDVPTAEARASLAEIMQGLDAACEALDVDGYDGEVIFYFDAMRELVNNPDVVTYDDAVRASYGIARA